MSELTECYRISEDHFSSVENLINNTIKSVIVPLCLDQESSPGPVRIRCKDWFPRSLYLIRSIR